MRTVKDLIETSVDKMEEIIDAELEKHFDINSPYGEITITMHGESWKIASRDLETRYDPSWKVTSRHETNVDGKPITIFTFKPKF